jgi:uncharacterized damage-inducible protein DinB
MNSTLTRSIRPATLEPARSMAVNEPPAVTLMTILQQLQAVIGCLRDEQYAMKPVGVVHSSIGAHVRHCLDHVRALLSAIEAGELDYDQRDRGTAIETERAAALAAMKSMRNRLASLSADVIDQPLQLSVLMTSDGVPFRFETSVGREMAYVLSHTIHHNALVGTMVKTLGGWLPDRFGYAPTTTAHEKTRAATACAH